jgi:hypothetical protein
MRTIQSQLLRTGASKENNKQGDNELWKCFLRPKEEEAQEKASMELQKLNAELNNVAVAGNSSGGRQRKCFLDLDVPPKMPEIHEDERNLVFRIIDVLREVGWIRH